MWWQIFLISISIQGYAGGRYAFFMKLHEHGKGNATYPSRRLFGGYSVPNDKYPNVCVLLNHFMDATCSCAVLSSRWALTAAHCTTHKQAHVRYKRYGQMRDAPIQLMYAHPQYRVEEKDEGAGMDVVLLHNDVGLVRTRTDMEVTSLHDPLNDMRVYDAERMYGETVEVLGFGKSEAAEAGKELRAARMTLAACQRGKDEWRHCSCGRGEATGVCAGDSGGPVMYKGKQVGVNSMGPVICSPQVLLSSYRGTEKPVVTSVFTSVHAYADLIQSTIHNAELNKEVQMTEIKPSGAYINTPRIAILVASVLQNVV